MRLATKFNRGEENNNNSSIFSSKIPRFMPDERIKLPGPGFYQFNDANKKVNYNQKGDGNGFLSKVERIPQRRFNEVPGPGFYTIPNTNKGDLSKCSFIKEKNFNRYTKGEPLPGPGAYNIRKTILRTQNSNPLSSLESKSKRLFQISDSNGIPSPGEYNPFSKEDLKSQRIKQEGEDLFKLKRKRDLTGEKKKIQDKILNEIQECRVIPTTKSPKTKLGRLHKRQSYNFPKNENSSRFENLLPKRRIPSPGKYELIHSAVPIVNNVGSVAFISESKRF